MTSSDDGWFRPVISGVFLGIAGAAVLETTKAILDLALIDTPALDAGWIRALIFGFFIVLSAVLAAISLRTSPAQFVYFLVPTIALTGIATLLIVAAAMAAGVLGPIALAPETLWALVGEFGIGLIVLVVFQAVWKPLAGVGRRISARSSSVRELSNRWVIATIGALLLVAAGFFTRK